jgi:hypothetical protein
MRSKSFYVMIAAAVSLISAIGIFAVIWRWGPDTRYSRVYNEVKNGVTVLQVEDSLCQLARSLSLQPYRQNDVYIPNLPNATTCLEVVDSRHWHYHFYFDRRDRLVAKHRNYE